MMAYKPVGQTNVGAFGGGLLPAIGRNTSEMWGVRLWGKSSMSTSVRRL